MPVSTALPRLSSLLLGGLALGGCMVGPSVVRREVYTREIEQAGVVPAPSGLHAVGPLAPEDGIAIEAELSTAAVSAPQRSREQGGPGVYVASDWTRVRVATGLNEHVELGLELEGSPLDRVHLMSTDVGYASVTGVLGRVSPWVRARAQNRGGSYLETQLQGSGTLLPYENLETRTTTTTTYDQGVETSALVAQDWTERQSALFFWGWRSGVSLGRVTKRGWDLSFGLSGEVLPSFYATNSATWSCTWWDNGRSFCEREPRRPADAAMVLALSSTLALGVPVGQTPFTLIGSLSGHASGSVRAPELRMVPYSGALGMRWTPGKE